MAFDPSSRSRLTAHTMPRFGGDGLFDRVARAVCAAECLPRKELYEAWEVARRVRRRLRGGRVVDLAAGHGLAAIIMLLLDDSSPSALCVDRVRPLSAERLLEVMTQQWPRLAGRISYQVADLATVPLTPDDLVVSVHACGTLTDTVLTRAVAGRARVAVLPCCHDLRQCDTAGLSAWMDGPLAVDTARALRLEQAGYTVALTSIPRAITEKNRLIMGWPADA